MAIKGLPIPENTPLVMLLTNRFKYVPINIAGTNVFPIEMTSLSSVAMLKTVSLFRGGKRIVGEKSTSVINSNKIISIRTS